MKLYSALLILSLTLMACDAKVKVEETGDSTSTVDTSSGKAPGGSDDGDKNVDTIVRVDTVKVPAPPDQGTPPQPGTPQGNIRVSSPAAGAVITGSQLVVKGTARTFENNVVYRLLSPETGELARGFTTATGEMGTFSPFTFTIPMKPDFAGPATLEVFEHSAKDGSVINLVRLPLTLRPSGETSSRERQLSVYFTNAQKNPGAEDCSRVFATRRTSSGTVAVAEAALNALLQGPSAAERSQGFGSEIPPGTVLRDITINNGVARADFSGELSRVAGSCRVTAIRAQIEKTLRQFSSVRSVVILVEGKGEDVLQP